MMSKHHLYIWQNMSLLKSLDIYFKRWYDSETLQKKMTSKYNLYRWQNMSLLKSHGPPSVSMAKLIATREVGHSNRVMNDDDVVVVGRCGTIIRTRMTMKWWWGWWWRWTLYFWWWRWGRNKRAWQRRWVPSECHWQGRWNVEEWRYSAKLGQVRESVRCPTCYWTVWVGSDRLGLGTKPFDTKTWSLSHCPSI